MLRIPSRRLEGEPPLCRAPEAPMQALSPCMSVASPGRWGAGNSHVCGYFGVGDPTS